MGKSGCGKKQWPFSLQLEEMEKFYTFPIGILGGVNESQKYLFEWIKWLCASGVCILWEWLVPFCLYAYIGTFYGKVTLMVKFSGQAKEVDRCH